MTNDSSASIDQKKKKENLPPSNAILFEQSRYIKKNNRDPRLIRSPNHEDFIVAKHHVDLIESLKKEYVSREIYDSIIEESPRVQELTGLKIWKEEEMAQKVKELLNVCLRSNLNLADAAIASDFSIRVQYDQCEALKEEIVCLEKQIQHLKSQRDQDVWPEPIPLKKAFLPVPPFDANLLPEAMRRYAEDVSETLQCPIDYLAIGLLVSFSSIIGAGCVIRPLQKGDWSVVANLWGAIVGPPSVKKTPALNAAMVPLAVLEKDADMKFELEKIKAAAEKIEIEARRKAAKSKMEKAIESEDKRDIESVKASLVRLEQEEGLVRWKRFKTNDCTVEKLTELLADNPRGLLVFRDEIIGFLASMEKEGREDSRAFYIEAWTGYSSSSVKSDRVKRGTISCNPCVSILGGIQPSKLCLYLQESLLNIGNDGLIQRFQMLTFPDRPKEWRLVDRKADVVARDRLVSTARILADTDFLSLGGMIDGDFPLPVFRFSYEAQEFFNQWLSTLEIRFLEELDDGLFTEHLAKYRSLMPSLALIIYLTRIASGETTEREIEMQDAQKAAALCAYLEEHARRVYSMIDEKRTYAAKILLKKIRDGDVVDAFTQRSIYRKGWTGLSKVNDVEEACNELMTLGWLKEEVVPSSIKGGPATVKYRLHPNLMKINNEPTDKTDSTIE